MNALVTGSGQVGQAIAQTLSRRGDSVSFFGSKDGRSTFLERASRNDVVFLAIPTRDTGEIALGYLREALQVGKPVVTCEKGMLAYHFEEVKADLNRLGYMASVGGGSRMLSLFAFPRLGLKRIVGIVNGTLNFLFSECAHGQDPYVVLAHAQKLGLCEPGGTTLKEVVDAELRDVLLKLTILFNSSGISREVLTADEFGNVLVSEDEILRQLSRRCMRFAVSISLERNRAFSDSLYSCLYIRKGQWHIEAGLADIAMLPFNPLPRAQQNALIVEDGAGITQIFGPGAGPIPTAAAMVMDADDLVG